jgi:beta-glucanase (GH16 family)
VIRTGWRIAGVAVAVVAVVVPGAMLSLRGIDELDSDASSRSPPTTSTPSGPPVTVPDIGRPDATAPRVTAPDGSSVTVPDIGRPDATAPRVTAPDGSSVGEPAPAGSAGHAREWRLVFADEFDGDDLDETSWARCYWWSESGCTNASNHEEQWYVPGAVDVADGTLRLTADRQSVEGDEGRPFDYTSGIVSGMGHDGPRRLFKYGYFEMRARIPRGKGLWPAFWMLPATHESKPEIDIMEILGQQPDATLMYLHWRDDAGDVQSTGQWWHGTDYSAGWHTFAVHWEPGRLTWYVDGVRGLVLDGEDVDVPDEDMYLLANLAVGGDFATSPDGTAFPATFEIDYVRVWT